MLDYSASITMNFQTFMKIRTYRSPRVFASALAASLLLWAGCNQFKKLMPEEPAKQRAHKKTTPVPGLNIETDTGAEPDSDSQAPSEADLLAHHPEFHGASHDLAADERSGGHTLRKHVGRTDDELRERLAREGISASSTYTDRAAAQFAVGNALEENQNRIEQWMARSGHPNLVLDYHTDQPIGRTLHRGDSSSRPCDRAKIVLRWISSSEYYVLTSYPECR